MTATETSTPASRTWHGSGPTVSVQFLGLGYGGTGVGYFLLAEPACAGLAGGGVVGRGVSWPMSQPAAPKARTTRRIQLRAPFPMVPPPSKAGRPPRRG